MKPRIRKSGQFWQCTTPEAQGIGATPDLAYREYKELWLDGWHAKMEINRKEHERKRIEFEVQMATINHRTMMAAYGFETDEGGRIVKDVWVTEYLKQMPPKPVGEKSIEGMIRSLDVQEFIPATPARWWEFWK